MLFYCLSVVKSTRHTDGYQKNKYGKIKTNVKERSQKVTRSDQDHN